MLCTHRQVTFIAVATIAPQPTAIHLHQSDPDLGHTSYFSAFTQVSAIRRQIWRSGRLLCSKAGSGRSRGEPAPTAHGVDALLFGRGSYIVRVRAATGEFLAQSAPPRQIPGGAKLMGTPIRLTTRRPPRRDLFPPPGLGAAARRLPDSRDGVDGPGLTMRVLALELTLRTRLA
jgi:hypothetical protein